YQAGILYVNINGPGIRKIKVFCDCIDEVSGDPDGLNYVAHFYYENPNDESLYILNGEENFIAGESVYKGLLPEIFHAGIGHVNIKFDGSKIVWNLESFDRNRKTSSTTSASSNTKKCNLEGSSARISGSDITKDNILGDISINSYPNPVSDNLYIELSNLDVSIIDIHLIDIQGKLYDVKFKRNKSGNQLEVDMRHLNSGLYLLRMELDQKQEIIRVIKK
ncbi:MAG: T9SS type A sorting domain-containing protein, partial [Cyclobacteriaceae bacterium]|nr:T9SS type A sorting domain-containing protein [Cyclobacteriaceae bacterium]